MSISIEKWYHAGFDLEHRWREFLGKVPKDHQNGPGLYAAQTREHARRYQKGNRSLYELTLRLDSGYELSQIVINLSSIEEQLLSCFNKKMTKHLVGLMEDKSRKYGITPYWKFLLNLIIDEYHQHPHKFRGSDWAQLQRVVASLGPTYAVEDVWGRKIIVIFNPEVVQEVVNVSKNR